MISYARGAVNGGLIVIKCGNATCASGNVISVVANAGILGTALMVPASDGLPVIAYAVATNNDLRVVKCSNSGCAIP